MLFRVDIIALFYKMIKGPEGLDPISSSFKEWDELVRQLIKKCTKKIEQRPELIIEMLFSKINSTAHYLEYGYEKQTVSTKPRVAAELEVKAGMEWQEQVGVVVGALLDRNEGDLLQWIKEQLSSAESERRAWEGANAALKSVEDDPFADDAAPSAEVEQPKAPSMRKLLILFKFHLLICHSGQSKRRQMQDRDVQEWPLTPPHDFDWVSASWRDR